MRRIRGKRISMVMQDPKFSLNPVMTIGRQIAEAYRANSGVPKAQARERSAGDAGSRAHPRSRARLCTSIPTSSRAAWGSGR